LKDAVTIFGFRKVQNREVAVTHQKEIWKKVNSWLWLDLTWLGDLPRKSDFRIASCFLIPCITILVFSGVIVK
jgi:hypothetical protein